MWINWVLLILTLALAAAAVAVFVWVARSGHFADLEDAGFAVLRAEPEEEEPSGRVPS